MTNDRPLPSDDNAERAILGSILLNNVIMDDIRSLLTYADFYSRFHLQVFQGMLSLHDAGKPLDPITIYKELETLNIRLPEGHSASTITQLTTDIPYAKPGSNALKEWAVSVKHMSAARKMIMLCNSTINELWLGSGEKVTEVVDAFESEVTSLNSSLQFNQKEGPDGFTPIDQIVPTIAQQFSDYHEGVTTGVQSGMAPLDRMLDGGGFQPGGLYVVGAPEKTGKTSLALGWSYDIAAMQGFAVPWVTAEMSKETLTKRLYSAHMGIPYSMFRPGMYDSPNNPVYTNAVKGLADFGKIPIYIADRLFGLDKIVRYVTRLVESHRRPGKPEIRTVFIDYLQIIAYQGNASTREREVSVISRTLKQLASELGVAVIVISNLNRTGLQEGQEPTSLNLRDSGNIAFDAEAVMLLHNPAYVPGKPYIPTPITDINLIIDRQRNGPTGRIKLKFVGSFMQFLTEEQYVAHMGVENEDPKSVGQVAQEKTDLDKFWEE